ncbi:hypothetical protein EUGRSUZ_F01966 [Eucalyptus grandis]|uniref:Uncharacterized protein n=2 Tax=Eucalyptus grandis TaxID=71139 RepID=A0ACC3KG02_EUCGR|nr:hypothetical protein EUGRSUZ_F01966 [Eucalyptus grandis]
MMQRIDRIRSSSRGTAAIRWTDWLSDRSKLDRFEDARRDMDVGSPPATDRWMSDHLDVENEPKNSRNRSGISEIAARSRSQKMNRSEPKTNSNAGLVLCG